MIKNNKSQDNRNQTANELFKISGKMRMDR